MGDTVQRLMEDMVPELEDLQRKGILSKPEIQSLVTRRTDLEYKLRRVHISKVDFLRALEFEMNFVQLVSRRRERLGITKKGLADFAALRRIAFLYERALRKFHTDILLWKQYLEFLRKSGSTNLVSRVLPRATQLNPRETSLWLLHASWELEFNANIEGARTVLQRALRLNGSRKELWTAFAKMEVRFIAKMLERRRRMGVVEDDDVAKKEEEAGAEDDGMIKLAKPTVALSTDDSADGGAEGDLSRRQLLALQSCVLPRAIFKNACVVKGLRDDLEFRLEFLSIIPSKFSAALSALPQQSEDEHDSASPTPLFPSVSLSSYAYNHNASDALLHAFIKYNCVTHNMIRARRADAAAAAGGNAGSNKAHNTNRYDPDAEEEEGVYRQSTRPYSVDFLPWIQEILGSIRRDFPADARGVQLEAEFEFIRARLQREEQAQAEAADIEEADRRSPAQVAFAVYEAVVSSPARVAEMVEAASAYYAAHKQVVDADPTGRSAHLLSARGVREQLWESYARFAQGTVLPALEEEGGERAEVKRFIQKLHKRIEAEGVRTERIVRQHADFMLAMGQTEQTLEILAQALRKPAAASSSAAADLSRSLPLWTRAIDLHLTLHAFQRDRDMGADEDAAAAHNNKKRKKVAAAASPASSSSSSVVSRADVLALFERALVSVSPGADQLVIYGELLRFHRSEFVSAAAHPPVHAGGESPATVRSKLVAAYLDVHAAYRRVMSLIPQPPHLDRLKVEYLTWMRAAALGEAYHSMQQHTQRGRKGTGAATASTHTSHASKKARKAAAAKAAAAADSDEDDDAAAGAGLDASWPAGVPSLSLSPAAAVRQLVDSLLASPPVTLSLLQACIQTEDALSPESFASPLSAPTVGASAAVVGAAAVSAAEAAAALTLHTRRLKSLYERALLSFGSTSPDLWFAYLSWARATTARRPAALTTGADSSQINPNQIHFRATRELKPEHQAHWAELQSLLVQ